MASSTWCTHLKKHLANSTSNLSFSFQLPKKKKEHFLFFNCVNIIIIIRCLFEAKFPTDPIQNGARLDLCNRESVCLRIDVVMDIYRTRIHFEDFRFYLSIQESLHSLRLSVFIRSVYFPFCLFCVYNTSLYKFVKRVGNTKSGQEKKCTKQTKKIREKRQHHLIFLYLVPQLELLLL